jgi:transcription elongation GreA/GreB family factor
MHDPQTTAAKNAARRWLERSATLEYADQKRQTKRIQWQIAVLKRKLKYEKNYEAIALLPYLKAAMLSHLKNCDDCRT